MYLQFLFLMNTLANTEQKCYFIFNANNLKLKSINGRWLEQILVIDG